MGSVDVKLLRKNRRWDLSDRQMFSSACIIDLSMLVAGTIAPQDLHQSSVSSLEGTFILFV